MTCAKCNHSHVRWRRWVDEVVRQVPLVRGQLHGVERRRMQEEMREATSRRDMKWDSNQRKSAIKSFRKLDPSPGPMRTTTISERDGTPQMVSNPSELRDCLDQRFEDWMSERLFQQTPLDGFWYQHPAQSVLVSDTPEGAAMRVRAHAGTLTAEDLASVPDRYHGVLAGARAKFLPDLGTWAHPGLYEEQGCMQPISQMHWHRYWAHTKKGTAAGASHLSVNMVWALQRKVPTPPDSHMHCEGSGGSYSSQRQIRGALSHGTRL